MSNPTWPAELPELPERQGFKETLPDIKVETPMEIGEPQSRRRYTAAPRPINVQFLMTVAQTVAFEEFYMAYPATAWDWLSPRLQLPRTYKFKGEPPEMVEVGPDKWRVTFELWELP